MIAAVKGGVGAFAREMSAEALLVGADYADDTGAENAEQLRSLGASMLAAPEVSERAAAQARKNNGLRALLKGARKGQRQRLARGGLDAGWFTDAKLAWRGLTARERTYLEGEAGEFGYSVLSVIPRADKGAVITFGSIDVDLYGRDDKETRVAVHGPDGAQCGAVALWRVLILVKRFPGAVWKWQGECAPVSLVQEGEVVAVLMPMSS